MYVYIHTYAQSVQRGATKQSVMDIGYIHYVRIHTHTVGATERVAAVRDIGH